MCHEKLLELYKVALEIIDREPQEGLLNENEQLRVFSLPCPLCENEEETHELGLNFHNHTFYCTECGEEEIQTDTITEALVKKATDLADRLEGFVLLLPLLQS